MNVAASQAASEVWPKLEGLMVDGIFPLQRCLGSSDHSGVFVSEPVDGSAKVALKLVAATDLAEVQLSHWLRAAGLSHPQLVRIRQAGRCEIEGQPYLYAAMELADQNLAQLLTYRALTEDEARDMLMPTVRALIYLHDKKFVQGQLKPSNFLAVGDELKLASDTIRPMGEALDGARVATVYDAPEGRYSAASDIWALGVTLFESLMRRSPPGLRPGDDGVVLPADFPPGFRDIVARCLSLRPEARPTVAELEAWSRRQPVATGAAATATAIGARPPVRYALPVTLGAVALLALGWAGSRLLRTHPSAAQPPASTAGPGTAAAPVPVPLHPQTAAPAAQGEPSDSGTAAAPLELSKVVPDIPRRASQTIRGHIRVSVRVIVDKEGHVIAALVDQSGPSRYFERLATHAAKKWTFAPTSTERRRVMLVHFTFSHQGTTAYAALVR